ncbi:hypothetical protein QLL95_gp1091 [Cotonvirus japonicus]|uniref:Uncharacterized protein n=1 Tax=Cotonvirus japonicus TaxID=2811091 RepID=A0ABM7NS93_9VIRU|nr:hypothetical protein QLL95_gp1091 [Cotonvirus japonicus]BCS83032.1 hypothetical protein [Cotonvirus japonicus]
MCINYILTKIFLYLYPHIFKFQVFLWNIIFEKISEFKCIYYMDENDNIINITFRYYLNCFLNNYQKGNYYVKCYNKYGINHVAFNGKLTEINKFKPTSSNIFIKKRNFSLSYENKPVILSLDVFDNYKTNICFYKDTHIQDLGKICKFFGVNCDTVSILIMKPFSRTNKNIKDSIINDLYFD